ncbi:MAP7 domain-containing protein 2a isoform X2 [Corythoichthys intestinalis]|uniref:MAP7 domain-containing protein 2a isoform X2 n=1 Tax=Corythoichthys intestinalis TaxID=161448 RepID=UPI0025A54E82|nr:MAP7 domain-containing protein 2a isoform X2 [Corythoichthys intestinalis]
MANTATLSESVTAEEKMAPPTVPLHPEKKSGTNNHSSPARTKKTTNADKKPILNGHAPSSHLIANINTSHVGKPTVEGFMKTDDRMRLAKERREERDRSLAAREQLIREKERRSQLQYERTVEERWKRLEEQRHKEDQRRAAVEEKRRMQLEEERERLEALMRRSLERSLNLENRHKRMNRGYLVGAGETENASLSYSAAVTLSHGLASPLPAVSESAPCSPRRSPLYTSRSPGESYRSGLLEGSFSTPNTPKKERLQREKRAPSPGVTMTKKRSDSPANATKQKAQTTSKLGFKTRMESPSTTHETKPWLANDKKAHWKGEALGKVNIHNHNAADTFKVSSSEVLKGDAPDKKDVTHNGEKKREASPCPTSGKVAAGITNADEASKLLAERRRLACVQKEFEDKKQEKADEARPKEEQLTMHAQEQRQREIKVFGKNGPDFNKTIQQEHKRLQDLQEKEREKVQIEVLEEVQRQRQDREYLTQQEEEERQLRKKRIEEIMKRTRKGEADVKDEQVETRSPPGDLKAVGSKAQQDVKWCKEQVTSQKEAQTVCQKHVENNARPEILVHIVPDKRPDSEKIIDANKINKDGIDDPQLKNREMQVNANKKPRINCKDKEPFKEPTIMESDRVNQNDMKDHMTAEGSKQKITSSEGGTIERVTARPLGLRPPPSIYLQPLEVKQSHDEVKSMDVSPASKEELISIPEFSPVNEIQQCGISNTRALEDLMDLTGSVTCSKRISEGNVGDCNKNLIQGVVSPTVDSKIIGVSAPTNKPNIH